MRTTITLDPDTEALVQRAMRERGLTFKQAVNEAIRAGLAGRGAKRRRRLPTHDLGRPLIDLTHAVRVSAQLEDAELARRLDQGQ